MASRKRVLKRLRQIGGYLLAVIIIVLIAEWVSRGMQDKLLDPREYPVRAFDPFVGYTFKPYLATDIENPAGERVVIDINSLGLRDREITVKGRSEIRIVGVGDGLTAATTVSLSNTYLKQIERMAQDEAGADRILRVINGAVDGYNLEQVCGLLMKLGEQLDPDVVLLGLHVGDDIRDYGKRQGLALPGKKSLRKKSYLYHLLQCWYQKIKSRKPDVAPDPAELKAWRDVLTRYEESPEDDALIRYVRGAKREVLLYHRDGIPETSRSMTQDVLGEILKCTETRGAKLVLALLPTKRQVLPREWEKTTELLDLEADDYDLDQPQEVLFDIASDLQIPAVDLLPAFRDHPTRDSLYWQGYRYWTPEAHRLAAEVIYDFLVRGGLLQ
jgi:hypothetical protein